MPRASGLFRGLAGLPLLVVAVLISVAAALGVRPLVRIVLPLVGVELAFLLPVIALAGTRRLLPALRLARRLLLTGLRLLGAVV